MNQLIFDFADQSYPEYDTFVGRANGALLQILKSGSEQFVLVWGEEGCGKSHLLRACVEQAKKLGQNAEYVDAAHEGCGAWLWDCDLVAIDQIEHLNRHEQQQLFALFNHFRNKNKGKLLLSSTLPPSQLVLREDLRTRLAYCLVYEIKPLSDEEKIAALRSVAKTRQIPVDDDVLRYLLNHWRRDLDSLLLMLNTLNDYSLAQKRRITLPLLRALLKQQEVS